MTTTIKFAKFPFTHKGIHFLSKVAETNRYLPQIMLMGDAFIEMNKDAIDELINLDKNNTLEAIQEILDIINEGGIEMFLELGHETLKGN